MADNKMDEEKKENKNNLFTITAKAVILNEKDKVLLVKRQENDHHGAGKWDLPGGKLEDGEGIKEGLVREIKEELGIDIELGPILYVFDFEKKYNRKIIIDEEELMISGKGLRFLGFYKSGEVKLSKEHSCYEWNSIEEALKKFGLNDFEKDKKVSLKKAAEYLEMKKSLDNWRRCLADFDNYKKEQMRRMDDFRNFTKVDFLTQILPVLDNFHASTDHVPVEQKNSPWVSGIMHIQKQLEKVLEDNGASEIPVKVGDEFNPALHEAVQGDTKETNIDTKDMNKVSKILQKGYKINEKIIRAAKVIVE